jgi:hypothetical protein
VPFTKFDEDLEIAPGGRAVLAHGPFEKRPGEEMKTFWARVCQGEHVAEGSISGDFSATMLGGMPSWELELPVRGKATFSPGDAAATAVLVWEEDEGETLLSMTWTYVVHLHNRESARS